MGGVLYVLFYSLFPCGHASLFVFRRVRSAIRFPRIHYLQPVALLDSRDRWAVPLVFQHINLTPFRDLRLVMCISVLVLHCDPYAGSGVACGFAFALPGGTLDRTMLISLPPPQLLYMDESAPAAMESVGL